MSDGEMWAALGAFVYALIVGLTLWCWHGDAVCRRWQRWRARRWDARRDAYTRTKGEAK